MKKQVEGAEGDESFPQHPFPAPTKKTPSLMLGSLQHLNFKQSAHPNVFYNGILNYS